MRLGVGRNVPVGTNTVGAIGDAVPEPLGDISAEKDQDSDVLPSWLLLDDDVIAALGI